MERFVCVHGHFYQPPRENPWLEAVESQDSARPYHDWNQRITAECYRPNGSARILDQDGYIRAVVNNYARISFNVGPTLLAWLESEAPDVYRAILEADRSSRQRFGGHGSAMAQAYNHVILPLAPTADRRTQIRWGLRDFERRFGRRAEGFWLPETAVDDETLLLLEDEGVAFTVLSPHQALRLWPLDLSEGRDVEAAGVDTTRPYRVKVGRRLLKLAVFFYDPGLSQAVAFNGLLSDGEQLARALTAAAAAGPGPRLAHIATDGETYGHHHRYGEMALAYALDRIESGGAAQLTNYGEFLERYAPGEAVEVRPDTSWSCAHGVERWRADCGCRTGVHPDWSQGWRQPLRAALDVLRDAVTPAYRALAEQFLADPDRARDDYIRVILDRSEGARQEFLRRQARRELSPEEAIRVWKLMELQRHALLMYTSCGWFFDEVSGIETVQILQYAGRVMQLAADLFGWTPEAQVLELLAQAPSNVPAEGNARRVYETRVRPAMVDLGRVTAHWAVAALTHPDEARAVRLYCYRVSVHEQAVRAAGLTRMVTGRVTVTSTITQETESYYVGALHWGDHNLVGGIAPAGADDGYDSLLASLGPLFDSADIAGVLRVFAGAFGSRTFTLQNLFRDEQRRVLDLVLRTTLGEVERSLRQIYEYHAPLMRFLSEADTPLPAAFLTAASYVLNQALLRALEEPLINHERIRQLMDEIRQLAITVDQDDILFVLRERERQTADAWTRDPTDPERLAHVIQFLDLVEELPVSIDPGVLAIACFRLRAALTAPDLDERLREEAAAVARRLKIRWPEAQA